MRSSSLPIPLTEVVLEGGTVGSGIMVVVVVVLMVAIVVLMVIVVLVVVVVLAVTASVLRDWNLYCLHFFIFSFSGS